jgi:hypothetical protein
MHYDPTTTMPAKSSAGDIREMDRWSEVRKEVSSH